MDIDDILYGIFPVFLVFLAYLLALTVPLTIIDQIFYDVMRAEDANTQCIERGYREYQDYEAFPFSSKAYAVRCRTNTQDIGLTVHEGVP